MFVSQLMRRFVFEEWGGTETVVWQTAQQLKALGINTEILATSALSAQPYEQRSGLDIRRFDYQYPYWGLNAAGRLGLDKKGGNPLSPELERYLFKLPQLDLIHCHAMQRIAGLARRVARKRQIPYIVSFHGGHFDVPQSEVSAMRTPVGKAFHYGRLLDPWLRTAQAIPDADGLICVGYSEYLKTRHSYPDKPVLYLPNGVNTKQSSQGQGNRFRAAYGIPPEQRLLLCVARLDPQKNQLALIELMQRLQDSELGLVLIGPATSTDYTHRLKTALQRLPGQVWLIEGLPPDSQLLADAYAAAELFILPSIHEPFGIVVLEAWMHKKPVIAADVGGLSHLVKHQHNGLHFAGLEQLEAQTRQLLKTPAERLRLGEAGYHTACTQYSWEQISCRLRDFYRQVSECHQARNFPTQSSKSA